MATPLSIEDRNRLLAFQRLVQRFKASKLCQVPPERVRISRKFDVVNGGVEDRLEGYDGDTLQAQLPLIRQFISDGEEVQLTRILGLIAWKCPKEELKQRAAGVRANWLQLLNRKPDDSYQGIYGLTESLLQECKGLFYGPDGLFHVDPSVAVTDPPAPFTGARLHLCLQGLIGCLEETRQVVVEWLEADGNAPVAQQPQVGSDMAHDGSNGDD